MSLRSVHSFTLTPGNAGHQAVIDWLNAQTNKSGAVQDVLVAHVTGDQGASVSLSLLYRELKALRDEIRQMRVVQVVGAGPDSGSGTPQRHTALEKLRTQSS